MARIRSISPEACESRTLAELSDFEERVWWRILPHMDDQGRSKDDALLLRSKAFAVMAEVSEAMIEAALTTFSRKRLVIRYEVREQRYLQVRSWPRFQSPNNPSKARIPEPPGWHIDLDLREWVQDEPPSSHPNTNGEHRSYADPTVVLPEAYAEAGSRELGSRKLEVGVRNSSSSRSDSGTRAATPPVDNPDDDDADTIRATQALELLAQQRADQAAVNGQLRVRTQRGWRNLRKGILRDLQAELGQQALNLARTGGDPQRIAHQLDTADNAPLATVHAIHAPPPPPVPRCADCEMPLAAGHLRDCPQAAPAEGATP